MDSCYCCWFAAGFQNAAANLIFSRLVKLVIAVCNYHCMGRTAKSKTSAGGKRTESAKDAVNGGREKLARQKQTATAGLRQREMDVSSLAGWQLLQPLIGPRFLSFVKGRQWKWLPEIIDLAPGTRVGSLLICKGLKNVCHGSTISQKNSIFRSDLWFWKSDC